MELKIGDKLKDNDPRQQTRGLLTITAFGVRSAEGLLNVRARTTAGLEVRISTLRIHTDGKPRRSGFDLVRQG